MTTIHSTAVIEDGAQLGRDVVVGPYAVIGPDVVVGDECKIFAHAMVSGRTTLGAGCEVHPFAHIGGKTHESCEKTERFMAEKVVKALMQPAQLVAA